MAPNYYHCLELLSNSNNCTPIKVSRSRSSSPFKKCGGNTPSPIVKLCYNNLIIKSQQRSKDKSEDCPPGRDEEDPIPMQSKSSKILGLIQNPETRTLSMALMQSKHIVAESPGQTYLRRGVSPNT